MTGVWCKQASSAIEFTVDSSHPYSVYIQPETTNRPILEINREKLKNSYSLITSRYGFTNYESFLKKETLLSMFRQDEGALIEGEAYFQLLVLYLLVAVSIGVLVRINEEGWELEVPAQFPSSAKKALTNIKQDRYRKNH